MTSQDKASGKKQRWYHNVAAIYRVAKRQYSWIGWVCLAILVVSIVGVSIVVPIVLKPSVFGIIGWVLCGIGLGLVICTYLLTTLGNKALYKEMDGVRGAVGAVLGQVKKGWVVEEEPIAMNRRQDIIWRLVGRPGIVLISEGPASRVGRMLHDEEKRANRIAMATPVHLIQVGHEDGQVPLDKLLKTINKLPKQIHKEEVPRVAQRLNSLRAKTMGMPKGIDPSKAKINRRMFRGR